MNTTALNGKVTSIYEYRRPYGAGTKSTLLATTPTRIYESTDYGANWTYIANLTGTARPTWETFTDSSNVSHAFLANGVDFIKYDGTTVSAVASTYPWAQNPAYITAYDDRLIAAGCNSDPYKIWVSGILDGTDWFSGTDSAAVSWTMKGEKGNRVTGLGKVYNFLAIFQRRSVDIITEADPSSSTSQQITVSFNIGTTSHWSIQSIGNKLYFANENHFCRGKLIDAIENGLQIEYIDDNIVNKYKKIQNLDDIISIYDDTHNEIQWAIRNFGHIRNDMCLVYNLGLSDAKGELGMQDVWSGWFDGDGYEPYTLAPVICSDGMTRIYRGDEDGYIYVMEEDEQYKDEITAGNQDIVTSIHLPPFITYGMGARKRARDFIPRLYQKYEGSTTVQWVVDGSLLRPTTAYTIGLRNTVPYYHDGTDTKYKQLWNNTIWNDRPIMPTVITVNQPFNYIEFVITNSGANAQDEISYNGSELYYQVFGTRHVV